jgi:hypothetical protein
VCLLRFDVQDLRYAVVVWKCPTKGGRKERKRGGASAVAKVTAYGLVVSESSTCIDE